MARNALVTLLTDFGTSDPYVAAMKGAILTLCPRAQIVDISHDLPAHDILPAAFVLAQAAPNFPRETLHVVVVDPTVGTDRRILAARLGGQMYLLPDNGVITFVAGSQPMEAMHVVRNPAYLPAGASMTFHGRDIFAPVAAAILNGVDLHRLGPMPDTYKLLDLPAPAEQSGGLAGQVIYIDRFGNLVSNISSDDLVRRWKDLDRLRVWCAGKEIGPLVGAYAFVGPGKPLALINSMKLVEVAVNQGRAADLLGAAVGAEIVVRAG